VKALDLQKSVDRQKGGSGKRLPIRKQRTKRAAGQEVKKFSELQASTELRRRTGRKMLKLENLKYSEKLMKLS